MAQYKVPQDVEADDKLLGPFTFRQFVYLMIIGGLIAIDFLLWQIFPLLILISVPPILLLGALCFPFKKDQPMETYLSAIVAYHLKPHTRVWEPGEPEATIVITAPKKTDEVHLKDISQEEATHRLSFLAEIVDTEGYAIKGSGVKEEVYAEANATKDIFEMSENSTLNQALLSNSASHHEELVNQMREAIARNSSFSAGAPTISHHLGGNTIQPISQPVAAPMTPPTVTPIAQPQPTPQTPADIAPLSATGAVVAGTDPFNNQTSAIIQPDLPIPETNHKPTYEEEMANRSEYLPEDEKERLGGDYYTPKSHEEEGEEGVAEQTDVDYTESDLEKTEEQPATEESMNSGEAQPETEAQPESESEPSAEAEPKPEPEPAQPSQQMIDLANNPDFSIETIAQQANRINEENNKDEVYISLH